MEWWKNGTLGKKKADDVLILISDQYHLYKNRSHPPNPVFQNSIIPVPHGIRFRQSVLSLTWPRNPGFQC
jgi:hypothetical protein